MLKFSSLRVIPGSDLNLVSTLINIIHGYLELLAYYIIIFYTNNCAMYLAEINSIHCVFNNYYKSSINIS